MAVSQKLSDLGKKIGNDVLSDLTDSQEGLAPAMMDEIDLVLPASIEPYAKVIEDALEPALQAALASVIAKIKL